MYTSLPSAKLIQYTSTASPEIDVPPILMELTKKVHFCRFLEKEMNTARTEAEKEAVQTILLNTKIEIRAMEKKWKRTQATLHRSARAAPKKVAGTYPTQRIQ
jgi:hypothetical protein